MRAAVDFGQGVIPKRVHATENHQTAEYSFTCSAVQSFSFLTCVYSSPYTRTVGVSELVSKRKDDSPLDAGVVHLSD